jgi:hypothetical protein
VIALGRLFLCCMSRVCALPLIFWTVRAMSKDVAFPVLVKLAHTVLDQLEWGAFMESDLTEVMKSQAARARLLYDSRSIHAALDCAQYQRRRKK